MLDNKLSECNLTNDRDRLSCEAEPPQNTHVFTAASSRPQPHHILHSEKYHQHYFLVRRDAFTFLACLDTGGFHEFDNGDCLDYSFKLHWNDGKVCLLISVNHSRLVQIKVDDGVSFCGGERFDFNGGVLNFSRTIVKVFSGQQPIQQDMIRISSEINDLKNITEIPSLLYNHGRMRSISGACDLCTPNMQQDNHLAPTQCMKSCRYRSRVWLHGDTSECGKRDLSDFVYGVNVRARWADLCISETAHLLGFSCKTFCKITQNHEKNIQ